MTWVNEGRKKSWMGGFGWRWHLRKVEASGGKEAPVSLLLSLNGVGGSDGNVARNFYITQFSRIFFFFTFLRYKYSHKFVQRGSDDDVSGN